MFNKYLIFIARYLSEQIFFRNPVAKMALQKTFVPYKTKMKSVLKIMNQPLWTVPPKTTVNTINNEIRKILEKHPQRSPLPPKREIYNMQLYWN